mmetsp:Transcript_3257/g.6637  ORF Transcript_3257/g.6637 Transcript_3257/m.6637 type:complete len:383 (-) Transcript_3257:178-1326(-)
MQQPILPPIKSVTMADAHSVFPLPAAERELSILGEGNQAQSHQTMAEPGDAPHLEWNLPGCMSREQSAIHAMNLLPGLMSRETSGFAPMSREVSFHNDPFPAFSMSRENSAFTAVSREHSGFGDIAKAEEVKVPEVKDEAKPNEEACSVATTAQNSSEQEASNRVPLLFPGGLGISELVQAVVDLKKRKQEEEEADGGSDAEKSRPSSPQSKKARKQSANSNRGAHVRDRPEMQQNARDGQKHWGTQVRNMRKQWQEKEMFKHESFSKQVDMCARMHIKSQHECLLRQLQMAAVEGIIKPAAFAEDERESFLGWTGFSVVHNSGAEFRKRIEDLFASTPSDKTLNNTFRRAGLVPEHSWAEAWSGIGGFVYDRVKRQQYGGQ